MKSSDLRIPALGTSSLLVVFVVLALAVFSILSIATVSADRRLSESSISSALGYLSADAECEKMLSELRLGNIPEGIEKEGDVYSYSRKINEMQTLFVEVRVSGSDYEILRWSVEAVGNWEPDTDLPVWDGN